MQAQVLVEQGRPLEMREIACPEPNRDQVRIQVEACAVCRTDLHVVDGDLPHPKLPLVPGHEIVGRVHGIGEGVRNLSIGDRVGIPWLGWTCGECRYCLSDRENLCEKALFTGYTLDGGYAEMCVADQRFCLPLASESDPVSTAPFLCAGLIGYRCLRMTGDAERIGLYGFGAAAHIICQVAIGMGRRIFAFTKPQDKRGQDFAKRLGACWAGGSEELPPEELDAAILFAPVGKLVPLALKAVARGGIVVCGGIHMSDIPSFPYELLWGERVIRSVANLTRQDGTEFLELAARIGVRTETTIYPLEAANQALTDLREGRLEGAAVLQISPAPTSTS